MKAITFIKLLNETISNEELCQKRAGYANPQSHASKQDSAKKGKNPVVQKGLIKTGIRGGGCRSKFTEVRVIFVARWE